MQLKIQNGVVELSGEPILSEVNIEINDASKIAVVGRNGCGKTTLLKLISGEYSLTKLDSDEQSFFAVSGKPKIGVLTQMAFDNDSVTLIEEIRSAYSEILSLKYELEAAQEILKLRRARMRETLQAKNREVNRPPEPPVDAEADCAFMRMALEEAQAAGMAGEIPVGAVVVAEGKVIARGGKRFLG